MVHRGAGWYIEGRGGTSKAGWYIEGGVVHRGWGGVPYRARGGTPRAGWYIEGGVVHRGWGGIPWVACPGRGTHFGAASAARWRRGSRLCRCGAPRGTSAPASSGAHRQTGSQGTHPSLQHTPSRTSGPATLRLTPPLTPKNHFATKYL